VKFKPTQCDDVAMCSFVTHGIFEHTKHCFLEVEGNGIMVCLYTTHYDSKTLLSNIYVIYFDFVVIFCLFLFYISLNNKASAQYWFQCFYFQVFEVEIMMMHAKKQC
jgi:hypothetical protein